MKKACARTALSIERRARSLPRRTFTKRRRVRPGRLGLPAIDSAASRPLDRGESLQTPSSLFARNRPPLPSQGDDASRLSLCFHIFRRSPMKPTQPSGSFGKRGTGHFEGAGLKIEFSTASTLGIIFLMLETQKN